MKLIKNKIFLGILIIGLFVNLLVFFDFQYLYLRVIFSFIFLITIPGLLIMLMLKVKKIGFWEYFIYVIGLSIAFLMLGGLAINWILPCLYITDEPLSPIPLLISFDIFLLIFGFIAYKRNKNIFLTIKLPKLDCLNKVFFIFPIIFPILSILGTTTLNNGGPNYLTLIMLGGIAVYVFFIVLFRERLNENIYHWAILMISISLLLMPSLRSWHISGWDIHQEYRVFQLTKENFHWSMLSSPGNAYNACLSITILPTILSSFLQINDEYIFKLVFQIVFSFVPIIVFLFLRRYTQGIIAFLASFFFISQCQFMQMPWITRQEISFLFFALFLIALFDKNFNFSIKNTLLLIFGFSMIISHYSTTYIALVLFTFVYFVWLFFRKTENTKVFSKIYQKLNLKEKGRSKRGKYYISGLLVLMLFVFTFLWSNQLTGTSDNISHIAKMTIINMGKIFMNEMKSDQALMALGFSVKTYTMDDVKNYRDNITKEYHTNKTWINFYSPEEYADYAIRPIYPQSISSPNSMIKFISGYLTKIVGRSLQISILIGVFYLLFFQLKKQEISTEYIVMSLGSIFLLGIVIIVPYISIGYNIERFFLQTLVLLSLPAVLGVLVVFKFLKNKNTKFILIAIMFLWYFLLFSGFTYQFVGGEPQMYLNDFGEMHERFYTYESEVKSLRWLSKYYNQKDEIYLDEYALLKAHSFSRINKKDVTIYILPSIIDKISYVYSSYTNKINKTTRVNNFENNFLEYNFPTEFLNDNKNKIYNNGDSEIFK